MKTYGLVGYPLSHSFSKVYFEQKFHSEKLEAEYNLYPLNNLSEFRKFIDSNPEIAGLNVTIPYKQQLIPLLDDLDETARQIGAVNCILVERKKNKAWLVGYNTDAFGFEESLKPLLNELPNKALILGTGGASKAVAHVFDRLGISYLFVSRNPYDCNQIRYSILNESLLNEFKFIANTTPLGMFPDIELIPAIPFQFITGEHFLYDLIYNPDETHFLIDGKAKGARTKNGWDMLKFQADKAWEIWNRK